MSMENGLSLPICPSFLKMHVFESVLENLCHLKLKLLMDKIDSDLGLIPTDVWP
jgi:hypothetical protein